MGNGSSEIIKSAKDNPISAFAAIFAMLAVLGVTGQYVLPGARADSFSGADAAELEVRIERRVVELVAKERARSEVTIKEERAITRAWRDAHESTSHATTAVQIGILISKMEALQTTVSRLEDKFDEATRNE